MSFGSNMAVILIYRPINRPVQRASIFWLPFRKVRVRIWRLVPVR